MAYASSAQRKPWQPIIGDARDPARTEVGSPAAPVDRDPPDLRDLYADRPDAPFLNGYYCKFAHDGACFNPALAGIAMATCGSASAEGIRLAGGESPWLDRALDPASPSGSVGDGARAAGGHMGLGSKLLALVLRLNAERRRVMPDWAAIPIYSAMLILLLLWAMGVI